MDKGKPTYDLEAFKSAASDKKQICFTTSAIKGAFALGMDIAHMVAVIQTMKRENFYKSMTSYAEHTVWQDVYHVPTGQHVIYIKFIAGRLVRFDLLSFKEK